MSNPAADVVVVTYFPGDTITSFLQSVVGADAVESVTVVDNAADDDVAERAAAEAEVAFVPAGRNGGYGAGANLGATHGSADWILISNADIVVSPGAIAALVAVGESDPRIGAVGPRVCEIDGTTYPSARPLPTLMTFLKAEKCSIVCVWRSPMTISALPARIGATRSPILACGYWLSPSVFTTMSAPCDIA